MPVVDDDDGLGVAKKWLVLSDESTNDSDRERLNFVQITREKIFPPTRSEMPRYPQFSEKWAVDKR